MGIFQAPAVITNPATLAANAKAVMEEELPGWSADADPQTSAILDAGAILAGEQNEVLAAELVAAYRSFGPTINVNPLPALPATALATFTTTKAPVGGLLLSAGSIVVGVRNLNMDLEGFVLAEDVTVPEGATTITGKVQAELEGAQGNGLSGICELIQAPAAVVSVTLAASGGGEDAESEADYLNRMTEALAIVRVGPVLASEAALVARSIPGVYRATAVDNLKPALADGGEGAEETGVERCVTVSALGQDGLTVSTGVRAAIDARLQELRESTFKFFVSPPHIMEVDVTLTAFAWPDTDIAAVKAEVLDALTKRLSSLGHGLDESGNPRYWANTPLLRLSDLYTIVGNVAGVRWCSALTFGKHGGALGTADLNLGGASLVPALPKANTITVTIEPS